MPLTQRKPRNFHPIDEESQQEISELAKNDPILARPQTPKATNEATTITSHSNSQNNHTTSTVKVLEEVHGLYSFTNM